MQTDDEHLYGEDVGTGDSVEDKNAKAIEQFEKRYQDYQERDASEELSNVTTTDINTGEELPYFTWVPYKGPQGGRGWENTRTGDIRYELRKPGPRESDIPEGTYKGI
ncbi:hypothetical protein [Halorubrum salipaludis]|uniref:hypothetical protein n=1 Tax=Halorubrum salipaludis TaxID=2032630 RepID=UPI0013040DDA|nr:hypothetical protein [Halorubrum salipaludis]